jgi:hypothetical protein
MGKYDYDFKKYCTSDLLIHSIHVFLHKTDKVTEKVHPQSTSYAHVYMIFIPTFFLGVEKVLKITYKDAAPSSLLLL